MSERALYRDDHLSQPKIARRLDQRKSSVWRRLVLVEVLDPAIRAGVRLRLGAPRPAIALAALTRIHTSTHGSDGERRQELYPIGAV